MMTGKNKSAFTLVELIVVITILAILGTIAFISLQGYSRDSRNSVRISDTNLMKKSLELYNLDAGKYPMPDNGNAVSYSGETLWTQGLFGENVVTNLSRNLSEVPKDPLTDLSYTYSVTNNKSEYQILALLEGSDLTNLNTINTTNAADSKVYPKLTGIYNGVFVKSPNYIVPTPSIINAEVGEVELILNATNIRSQVLTGYENVLKVGSINAQTGALDISLSVYEGTLDKNTSDAEKQLVIQSIQNAYSGSNIENEPQIEYVLENTTSEELTDVFDVIVLNNGGTSSSISTTTYSCIGSVPSSNVATSNNTGLTADTAWQNTQSGNDCYYECTGGYTGANCDIAPALITSTDCTSAGWIWVANDVYIGSSQGNGFCISPRVGDFAGDTIGNGISFNGWGNQADGNYGGWDHRSIDDSGNPYRQYGQTKRLDSSAGYTCKSLGTSSTDFDTTDNIVGRMKWLATNKVNLTELQDIEWVQNATPPNGHPIPALYIADCIDGVKDLGTTMTYTHNNDTTDEVTYAEYSTDVSLNTDTAYLSDITYQNRQKYLTAWTQETGSHLPSAMSYITSGYASASDADGDFLTTTSRGEYQVACEASLLTDANDDTDNEWIWTSAIGSTTGTGWGRIARVVGSNGCGDQHYIATGIRGGTTSARFVVRP